MPSRRPCKPCSGPGNIPVPLSPRAPLLGRFYRLGAAFSMPRIPGEGKPKSIINEKAARRLYNQF